MKGTHATGMVVGYIGHDIVLRYTVQGEAAVHLNIAIHYNGNSDAKPHWLKVSVFGKRAEQLKENAKKGSKLLASGRIKVFNQESSKGGVRSYTYIEANHVELC